MSGFDEDMESCEYRNISYRVSEIPIIELDFTL